MTFKRSLWNPLPREQREYLYNLFGLHRTVAMTLIARSGDDFTLAAAMFTRGDGLRTAEERVDNLGHATRTTTRGAGVVRVGVFGTRATALVAGGEFIDFEFLGCAVHNLLERQRNLDAQVRTTIDSLT